MEEVKEYRAQYIGFPLPSQAGKSMKRIGKKTFIWFILFSLDGFISLVSQK